MDNPDNTNAPYNDDPVLAALLSSRAKRLISSIVNDICSKQDDETAPPAEENDGPPPAKRAKLAFRPLLMDVSVTCNREESTGVEKIVAYSGEPTAPTPEGHVLAAKATMMFSKEAREAMERSAEEHWPALKNAPGHSPGLYSAQLRYSTEEGLYTVRITRWNASTSDNRGDEDEGAENVAAFAEGLPAQPVEFETDDAEEAVDFLLDNMEEPRLFNLRIVRGEDVVSALKKREDKKLIVEHALKIEYHEGIAPASPQEVIECMGEVESVLLRNMPGAQAKYIKNYLDNSLLELCQRKNIPRIWMPTVSCPKITEDAMIEFCFGGDAVSHVFQEHKLRIYGPNVTPYFFETLVEVSTKSDRAQILELRARRINLERQHTRKYEARKKTLPHSSIESENGWYYDFTHNVVPFQIAFLPERNQRCIILRRGPKDMVGNDWFY